METPPTSPTNASAEVENHGDNNERATGLSSLQFYDDLRRQVEADLIREEGSLVDVLENDEERLGFVHFVSLLAFTDPSGAYFQVGYEIAIGVALALQHLNAGDGSLIGPVEGLDQRCKLRFTGEFIDTGLNGAQALNEVVPRTEPTYAGRKPSAFVGAVSSSVSSPSGIVSGLRGYPQMSGSSTSNDLDNKIKYPLFARTIPSDDGITESIILYLTKELGCTQLAVINVNESFGNGYVNGLRQAAAKHAPESLNLVQIPVSADGNKESLRQAITTLKDSGFLFVIAILIDNSQYDNLLKEAVQRDVAGNGRHNWMFADSVGIGTLRFPQGSPLVKAYEGSGRFQVSATFGEKFDSLDEQASGLKNPSDYTYLNQLLPNFTDSPFYSDEAFLHPIEYPFTPLFYESTILLGLAACGAAGSNLTFTGIEMYEKLVNYPPFGTISGVMELDPSSGSRVPDSAYFELSNFRQTTAIDPITGETVVEFQPTLTNMFHQGEWTTVAPFVYNDGTTKVPNWVELPDIDQNFIIPGVRAIALVLFAISFVTAIGFASWTWHRRGSRVVRASQPLFLYIICFGCAVLASAIIPLQFDTNIIPAEGCAVACNSAVWLICIGFSLVFSALYAKTRRINKIMQSAARFKKIQMKMKDTVKPMVVLLLLNFLVLALMTALDPIMYMAHVVEYDRFGQPEELHGHCAWEQSLPYVVTLVVINMIALILSLIEAWKARHLATEFAESECIGKALFLILMVVIIGVPILILSDNNSNATLFVSSAILFVMSFSILCLIFVPKILFERERQKKMSRRNLVTVSGLHPAPVGRPGELASFGRTSHSSGIEDDDSSSTTFGERILTAKTQKELAEENAVLRRLLDRERKKNTRVADAATNDDANLSSKHFSISFQADKDDGHVPIETFPGPTDFNSSVDDTREEDIMDVEKAKNANAAL